MPLYENTFKESIALSAMNHRYMFLQAKIQTLLLYIHTILFAIRANKILLYSLFKRIKKIPWKKYVIRTININLQRDIISVCINHVRTINTRIYRI